MDLTLDVNVELLPVEKEFKFSVELATTLNLDGTPDAGCYEQGQEKSAGNRLSSCDYAMHGKVFKYDNMSDNKVYAPRRALAARPPHKLTQLVATQCRVHVVWGAAHEANRGSEASGGGGDGCAVIHPHEANRAVISCICHEPTHGCR